MTYYGIPDWQWRLAVLMLFAVGRLIGRGKDPEDDMIFPLFVEHSPLEPDKNGGVTRGCVIPGTDAVCFEPEL